MRKDWLNPEPAAGCDQADQFITALNNPGGQAASGLTAGNFATLAGLVATLRASTDDKLVQEGIYRAAVAKERADHRLFKGQFRTFYRMANNNINMTDAIRGAAGLTIRDTEPSPRAMPKVTDLAAVGRPSGNNFLDWSAAGGVGVTWQVETAPSEGGPWTIVGTTSRTDFVHEGAGAGVARRYRVVPKRGARSGEPSNVAAVY
ncbi:MAG: hypothetical protein WAO58_04855 [Fimbriimonadaceae bacterium]